MHQQELAVQAPGANRCSVIISLRCKIMNKNSLFKLQARACRQCRPLLAGSRACCWYRSTDRVGKRQVLASRTEWPTI